MKKVSYLVSLMSVAIILLTLNRTANLTQNTLSPFEFLRWQDFHAMLSLPLVLSTLYTLLFIQIIHRRSHIHKRFGALILTFAIGILMYGISSGNHEITNYLSYRYCIQPSTSICEIIKYNDDTFSHIIFYIGSLLMTVSLLFFERVQSEPNPVSITDLRIILLNATLVGIGLFINLAFEELSVDLLAFGIFSAISIYLLWSKRKNFRFYPVTTYCAIGYGLGTISSLLYKLILI